MTRKTVRTAYGFSYGMISAMKEKMPTLGSESSENPPVDTKRYEVTLPLESELRNEDNEHVLRIVESVVEDESRFIDKGGAGTVHRIAPGICIKSMENRHTREDARNFDLGASPYEEAGFLYQMGNFEVAGVRSPKYLGYIAERKQGGKAFLLMEELDAFSLAHALSDDYEVELPDTFDIEKTFEALEMYFDELHTRQKVAHGDIAARNIMIDRDTGMPYVIDFGRSVSFADGGLNPRINKANPRKDFEALEAVEREVQEYLEKKI